MTTTFAIRSIGQADFVQWSVLWDGYNAFYERVGPTALAAEITYSTWNRFFDAEEPVHALVAERNGTLLGIVHYLFHRSTLLIEQNCYLQDLFTVEATRGQGIGGALIEAVYVRAREAGATRVYWHTQETNATARKLYDGIADCSGFIVYRKVLQP